MGKKLNFTVNEQTQRQRRAVVEFAVGVSLSQNRPPSTRMAELHNQYIAGQIDLEQLSAALDAEYQPRSGPDPYVRYAPGAGPQVEASHQYEPYLHFEESSVDPHLS